MESVEKNNYSRSYPLHTIKEKDTNILFSMQSVISTTLRATKAGTRAFSKSSASNTKVCVIGAAGGIGQPMSMLLKMNPDVTHLSLYDVINTPGVGADLGHINSSAKVTAHQGDDQLHEALSGCDVVVVPAGVPRKPGMTRDDLFNTNGSINAGLAAACAKACPDACFAIISNPVNSTVPIWAEVLKNAGVYNPKKLFGVTTLDVVRANGMVAENQNFDVYATDVTVIGGHAGTTIVPLLSQIEGADFSADDIAALTKRIQFGGDEVVQAKSSMGGSGGSATLSMAMAGAEFAGSLVSALQGQEGIVECTFVENDLTAAPFFSTPVTLGKNGIEEIHSFGELSAVEQENFDSMLPDLISQAEKGIEFVKGL